MTAASSEPLVFGRPEGWIALGLLLLFCMAFRYIMRFFELALPEMIHFHIAQKHFKENSVLIAHIRQLLFMLGAVVISFFALAIINRTIGGIEGLNPWQLYLLILAAFLAFYFLKTLLLYLLGFLSQTMDVMRMIIYYAQIYTIACGLLLLPGVILYSSPHDVFYNVLFIIELIICGSFLLLYLFRTLQIFIASNISVFFWILYLCTLEIVPFLIIYKYISLS